MPLAFVVTGVAALIIILAILAVIVLGIIYFVKLAARGAEKVAHIGDHHDSR